MLSDIIHKFQNTVEFDWTHSLLCNKIYGKGYFFLRTNMQSSQLLTVTGTEHLNYQFVVKTISHYLAFNQTSDSE